MIESPICPRCGYDLSGHVASWERACPVRGRCSECGLSFAWSDLFSEILIGPRWSFEHTPDGSPIAGHVRRMTASVLMVLHPGRMWRALRLEHEVRIRRLLLLGLVQMVLLHAVLFLLAWGSPRAFAAWTPSQWWANPNGSLLRLAIFPYDAFVVVSCGPGSVIGAPMALALAVSGISLLMPVSMLLLPITMRRIRVRRVHLLRGFVLALPMVPMTVGMLLVLAIVIACDQHVAVDWLSGRLLVATIWTVLVLILLWYGYWWRQYLQYYIRMPQPTLTTVVLIVLCGVFAFVSSFVVSVWS